MPKCRPANRSNGHAKPTKCLLRPPSHCDCEDRNPRPNITTGCSPYRAQSAHTPQTHSATELPATREQRGTSAGIELLVRVRLALAAGQAFADPLSKCTLKRPKGGSRSTRRRRFSTHSSLLHHQNHPFQAAELNGFLPQARIAMFGMTVAPPTARPPLQILHVRRARQNSHPGFVVRRASALYDIRYAPARITPMGTSQKRLPGGQDDIGLQNAVRRGTTAKPVKTRRGHVFESAAKLRKLCNRLLNADAIIQQSYRVRTYSENAQCYQEVWRCLGLTTFKRIRLTLTAYPNPSNPSASLPFLFVEGIDNLKDASHDLHRALIDVAHKTLLHLVRMPFEALSFQHLYSGPAITLHGNVSHEILYVGSRDWLVLQNGPWYSLRRCFSCCILRVGIGLVQQLQFQSIPSNVVLGPRYWILVGLGLRALRPALVSVVEIEDVLIVVFAHASKPPRAISLCPFPCRPLFPPNELLSLLSPLFFFFLTQSCSSLTFQHDFRMLLLPHLCLNICRILIVVHLFQPASCGLHCGSLVDMNWLGVHALPIGCSLVVRKSIEERVTKRCIGVRIAFGVWVRRFSWKRMCSLFRFLRGWCMAMLLLAPVAMAIILSRPTFPLL